MNFGSRCGGREIQTGGNTYWYFEDSAIAALRAETSAQRRDWAKRLFWVRFYL